MMVVIFMIMGLMMMINDDNVHVVINVEDDEKIEPPALRHNPGEDPSLLLRFLTPAHHCHHYHRHGHHHRHYYNYYHNCHHHRHHHCHHHCHIVNRHRHQHHQVCLSISSSSVFFHHQLSL